MKEVTEELVAGVWWRLVSKTSRFSCWIERRHSEREYRTQNDVFNGILPSAKAYLEGYNIT